MRTAPPLAAVVLGSLLGLGAAACSVEDRKNAPERRKVELGVDVLLAPGSEHAKLLEGKRVGLITHPAGVDGALTPTADRLARDPRWRLAWLYGPEHGIRGDAAAGDEVADATDSRTGVPVESLYGARRAPSTSSLADLDVVVFDLQDVGSRTYTYTSTLGEALKACAAAGKPLVVLDRPNPIGGTRFEGPIVEETWRSFIGWGPVPVTHGMTAGEIARYYVDALGLGCELAVVPMRGWTRDMTWEDTGLGWTTTSPHIPHALQAHLYVATGMVASSTRNISDGVGTPMPFEAIAAEFVDAPELAAALARHRLPGVRFQPTAFKPFYGKFANRPLRGVRLVLDDPRELRPLRTALAILVTLRQLHPDELDLESEAVIAKHWGNPRLLEQLRANLDVEAIEDSWGEELAEFAKAREAVLLY